MNTITIERDTETKFFDDEYRFTEIHLLRQELKYRNLVIATLRDKIKELESKVRTETQELTAWSVVENA